MPFIVTPTQLGQIAEFYHQLGSLTEAGLTLMQALEQLRRNPPSRKLRAQIGGLSLRLQQGYTFSEALRAVPGSLPAFDIALVEAGEQSGRLAECFKLLAGYYRDRAELIRNVVGSLAYPFFLAHVALMVFPTSSLVALVLSTGGFRSFVLQKLSVLVPLYGGLIVLAYLTQEQRGDTWRATLEGLLRWVPLLGTARRQLALARLSAALEALINAGVNIIAAWELAATASGSPALGRTVAKWRPRLEGGQTPAEVLSGSRAFPEMFANLYHSGEVSGQLDESMRRLHHHYQEEGSRKLRSFAKWSAQAVHLVIMLAIAWQVISFYLGYFDQINQATGP